MMYRTQDSRILEKRNPLPKLPKASLCNTKHSAAVKFSYWQFTVHTFS